MLETQRALLSLWHDCSGEVGLATSSSCFDRLRMRLLGDARVVLAPPVDAGLIERWKDGEYRNYFGRILEGGRASKKA